MGKESGRGYGGAVRGGEGERWGGEAMEAVREATVRSFLLLRQALLQM